MIKMHVVNAGNRHLYKKEMKDHFRLRYQSFVKERKWFPENDTGIERDQFDTENATYLLGMDDGEVISTSRLIPTSEPNLVSEVFHDMCDFAPPPRYENWADLTRGTVAKSHRGGGKGFGPVVGLMGIAYMEYCVRENIEYVGGLMSFYFQPLWAERGWETKTFGTPREIGGDQCLITYAKCTEGALKRGRKSIGLTRSLLTQRGELEPFIEDRPIIGAGRR